MIFWTYCFLRGWQTTSFWECVGCVGGRGLFGYKSLGRVCGGGCLATIFLDFFRLNYAIWVFLSLWYTIFWPEKQVHINPASDTSCTVTIIIRDMYGRSAKNAQVHETAIKGWHTCAKYRKKVRCRAEVLSSSLVVSIQHWRMQVSDNFTISKRLLTGKHFRPLTSCMYFLIHSDRAREISAATAWQAAYLASSKMNWCTRTLNAGGDTFEHAPFQNLKPRFLRGGLFKNQRELEAILL